MLLAIAGAGVGLLLSFWTTSFAVSSLASILPLSIVFRRRRTRTSCWPPRVRRIRDPARRCRASTEAVAPRPRQRSQGAGRFGCAAGSLHRTQCSSSPSSHCRWGCSAWVGSSREAHSTPATGPVHLRTGPSSPRSIPRGADPDVRGRELYRQVLERLRSTPGIEGVGRLNCAARPVPRGAPDRSSRGETRGTALRPDLPDHRGGLFQVPRAANDPRARLHAGRGVVANRAPRGDHRRRAGQMLFPNEDPIGQTIRFTPRGAAGYSGDFEPMTIVGISPSMHEELLDRGPTRTCSSLGPNFRSAMNLHVRSATADRGAERHDRDAPT